MSADEQPQGLNGMDLIIDGEQLNVVVTMPSIGCKFPMFCIQTYIYVFGFAGVRAFAFHSPLDASSLCAVPSR
jgi:hypothetical protein